LSVYLDTSVVVSLFAADAHTDAARQLLGQAEDLTISDLTAAEFAAVMAVHVRTGRVAELQARTLFTQFDTWCAMALERVEVLPATCAARKA
jgi:predicted nucleic acid-binding protein